MQRRLWFVASVLLEFVEGACHKPHFYLSPNKKIKGVKSGVVLATESVHWFLSNVKDTVHWGAQLQHLYIIICGLEYDLAGNTICCEHLQEEGRCQVLLSHFLVYVDIFVLLVFHDNICPSTLLPYCWTADVNFTIQQKH